MPTKRKRARITLSDAYGRLAETVVRYSWIEELMEKPDGEAILRRLSHLAVKAPERFDALVGGELGWLATLDREVKKAENAESLERWGYAVHEDEDVASDEPRSPAAVISIAGRSLAPRHTTRA